MRPELPKPAFIDKHGELFYSHEQLLAAQNEAYEIGVQATFKKMKIAKSKAIEASESMQSIAEKKFMLAMIDAISSFFDAEMLND